MDKNGNIRKNEFIEFSMESKLLDLSERKTNVSDTPKEIINLSHIYNAWLFKLTYLSMDFYQLTFSIDFFKSIVCTVGRQCIFCYRSHFWNYENSGI